MSKDKIEIPEELQQICRDLAKVAQKHGLHTLKGDFSPNTNWGGDVHFRWSAGRHGAESNQISITSNFYVHTKVKSEL